MMMVSLSLALLGLAASANAFSSSSKPRCNAPLSTLNAEHTRNSFLAQSISLFGSVALATTQGNPAIAASYGGFGTGPTAVLDPKDAEVDDQILASKPVQGAISKLKESRSAVTKMQDLLEKDSQANIRSILVKELELSNLRDSLNTFNTAFEEDTQRGTDRLIRAIMQDITELEIANRQKDDIPRSPRRLETMKAKLAKLDQAFSDILAFAK